ncbi:hypothetical protein EXIGLDRAFT_833867 [Exidia glandulosa HHB12029]|uniref:Uncharacterized protein n=1 Tax=Exidia glandulosa HHB12029 TaxID=1314781 RepID=A0A166AXQ1_EXIGL|nr:hypothetical protein EXIGLDRAFT_833867 [Exidia glandulosa HHB12029]
MPKDTRGKTPGNKRPRAKFYLSCQNCYKSRLKCSNCNIERADHPDYLASRGSCKSCKDKNVECVPRARRVPEFERDCEKAIELLEHAYEILKDAGRHKSDEKTRAIPDLVSKAKGILEERARARKEQQEAEFGTLTHSVEAIFQSNVPVIDQGITGNSVTPSDTVQHRDQAMASSAPSGAFDSSWDNAPGPPPYAMPQTEAGYPQQPEAIPLSAVFTLPPALSGSHAEPGVVSSDIVSVLPGYPSFTSLSPPPTLAHDASNVVGGGDPSSSSGSAPLPVVNDYMDNLTWDSSQGTAEEFSADIWIYLDPSAFDETDQDVEGIDGSAGLRL